jgi:LuxR family transcriptional regulator, quorum-sensing system regulator BjaR1
MTRSAEVFGQEALQFIGDVDRATTTEAVAQRMAGIVSRFGFEGLFIGGRKAHPRLSFNEILFATKCPPEFQRVYHENGYIRVDPTLKRALSSPHAFDFTTANYGEKDGARVPEIMSLLEDFNFSGGVVIPIHTRDGYEGAVGLVGDKLDLSVETRPNILLMAHYAYERLCNLAAGARPVRPPLTLREREVLAWSAQGKSAWEIGEILNLAKRTVDEHAKTAMRKLGAGTRTQAVAIAIRERLFDL